MASADAIDDDDGGGSSGVRSPRYPSMLLEDAVAKTKAIYDADKTAGTPIPSAIKHMGYKSKSGPATAALGALKRFGLIEKRGARLFPTQRAIAIIRLPIGDPRRKKALEDAVLSPEIYRQLIDQYRETGLPSADSLEHELILGGRFNHNAIPGFVKDFFGSLQYAGLTDENGVLLTSSDQDDEGEDESEGAEKGEDGAKGQPFGDMFANYFKPMVGKKVSDKGDGKEKMRELPVTLPSLNIAVVRVPAQMTELDFTTLVNSLNAWKPALVSADKPSPPAEPITPQSGGSGN